MSTITEAEDLLREVGDAGKLAQFEFIAYRGIAIQHYQALEQALCTVFSWASGTTPSVAGTIFFKITSTRSRMSILDRLVKKKMGSRYRTFWNAYLKEVGAIDQQRNEIVHWGTGVRVSADKKSARLFLTPPNFWDRSEETPEYSTRDLAAFGDKCDVYARALNMFWLACCSLPDVPEYQPWRDIFQQPLGYPLPPAHPLARSDTKPAIPPAPFLVSGN